MRFGLPLFSCCAAIILAATPLHADDLGQLAVVAGDYPRAFFFRASEGFAANLRVPYDRWDAAFSRLMGIEGKVLEEEIPGRSERNIEFFTQFKKEHPEQLVLLHYNGNARDPRYQTEKYFAGHWLYSNGARITSEVPAESGESDIRVDDVRLFRTNIGRYRNANDDVGLCMLDAEGKPDWSRSEQVELVSVDPGRKTIRVRRGCFGTVPREFPAGRAYAAAHKTEGPWGRKSRLLWYYNYATCCPRDAQGRTCAEVHADELAARFLPGGELATLDGLEFDVLHHEVGGGRLQGADCDADGRADHGRFDGVNQYGIGVVEFCRRLREKLGDRRLMLADGMSTRNQRAFGSLNGIESEGWPMLGDWEIRDWSGGLNRHHFWRVHGRPPVFNYVNHKFVTRGELPGDTRTPEVPFATHRLVMAAAMMTDSALCYCFAPRKRKGELIAIWDELVKGTECEVGWLGKPLGPPVALATRQADALEGQGSPIGKELLKRFTGAGVEFALEPRGLRIIAIDPAARELRFRLQDVPCMGPDLVVVTTMAGAPMRGYPDEVARLARVGIATPRGRLTHAELPEAGMCRRGSDEEELDTESGASVRWAGARELGGETRGAYLVHPPYRDGESGYTFWQRDVDVPPSGRLELFTGMGEKSPERSDGVVFRVLAAVLRRGEPGPWKELLEHRQVESRWVSHRIGLAEWAGERLRLKFLSDCGPKDNTTTDHSYWGDVEVLGAEGRRAVTEPVDHMTWVGPERFASRFYFSEVRSPMVDLEWSVEGSEPVWITSVEVCHHPDAVARAFEGGVALVNPSPRRYAFDLECLFSGWKFRRLQGSELQDPQTNDGSPVGGKVWLGPRDGLFLVAEEGGQKGAGQREEDKP